MPVLPIVYHPECEWHDPGPGHPESPARTRAIREFLDGSDLAPQLQWLRPEPAPAEAIEAVHTRAYHRFVEEACLSGRRHLDGDTPICHDSYHAARLAAGAAMLAVDQALRGPLGRAFSCARPPGHHARPAEGMGFCLFNNVAIAARHAQRVHGLRRILILDWDVHHGNGTQDVFYDDSSVFYCSIHQSPLYPGSGLDHERGLGPAHGTILNCPLPSGSGIEQYRAALADHLAPLAEEFAPELILISAGFDAHAEESIAGLRLQDRDFGELTRWTVLLAKRFCQGRVVSVLEGGYNLRSLSRSVECHLRALL